MTPLPSPSSFSLAACAKELLGGLLDVHSPQHVAASRLLLGAVLLAGAALHYMGRGRPLWGLLAEMARHAQAAQPKALDYMAARQELEEQQQRQLQQLQQQQQPQQPEATRVEEGRGPAAAAAAANSWALPTRAERALADVDLESLLDIASSPASSQQAWAAAPAAAAAAAPQPQLQPPPPAHQVVSCNANLPRSPVAAF